MLHLANLLLICLLLINLAGLAIVFYTFSRSWLSARAASPLLIAIPFFVEHFFGFGSLKWLWPITTAISIPLILTHLDVLKSHWRVEAVYHGAFAYALVWRYSFPDLYVSSEKICDLTFVANYMSGSRLPPVDRWLPPFPFDMYYSMQHYAAALLGRILDASVGTAYNLAICVIAASVVTAAAGVAWLLVRREGPALLLTLALVCGGSGVAPVIHLIMPNPQLHSGVRFMGSSLMPGSATRPLGRWLIHADHVSENHSLDLPIELFSYLVGLGDYHPPLSGYLLLMVALLSMALIETGETTRAAHAFLAATVPLTIPANAWDFPVQVLLVTAYLVYRLWCGKTIDWKALAAGGGAAALLIYPFLVRFAPNAENLHNALRLVPRGFHTPPLSGLLVFYPLLAVIALNLLFGDRSRQSRAFCAIWLTLFLISEFIFVDDLYSGKYERFNTALKWWAWIYSGTLLTVGAMNFRSPSRVCRWGTAAVMILISVYSVDLFVNLAGVPKPHFGQLDGAAWIRDDPSERAILAFLKTQPASIALQRLPDRAYLPAPALIIFAGQTALLGWANHEDTWRGYRLDIDRRMDAIHEFYSGDLTDAEGWLIANHVKYVLWLKEEGEIPEGTFEKIDQQIHRKYQWIDYSSQNGSREGLWIMNEDGR